MESMAQKGHTARPGERGEPTRYLTEGEGLP